MRSKFRHVALFGKYHTTTQGGALDSSRRDKILAAVGARRPTPVAAPGATYAAGAAIAPTSPNTLAARTAMEERKAPTPPPAAPGPGGGAPPGPMPPGPGGAPAPPHPADAEAHQDWNLASKISKRSRDMSGGA